MGQMRTNCATVQHTPFESEFKRPGPKITKKMVHNLTCIIKNEGYVRL